MVVRQSQLCVLDVIIADVYLNLIVVLMNSRCLAIHNQILPRTMYHFLIIPLAQIADLMLREII